MDAAVMIVEELNPFDVVCVAGVSRLSNAIRWVTRVGGEEASTVSHVGFVVQPGTIYTAEVQEALIEQGRVVRRPMISYAGTGERVAIYRPLNLTASDRATMETRAQNTWGAEYSLYNVGLHLVDGLLGKVLQRRVRLASRMATRKRQECSANVADVWAAAGYTFGVETGAADPDSISDFCRTHPDKYAVIRELAPIPEFRGQLMESA